MILSNLNQRFLSCLEISIHNQNVPRFPYVRLEFLMRPNVNNSNWNVSVSRNGERNIRIYKFKKCIKARSARLAIQKLLNNILEWKLLKYSDEHHISRIAYESNSKFRVGKRELCVTFILSIVGQRVNLYRYIFFLAAHKARRGEVVCIFLARVTSPPHTIWGRNNAYPARCCGARETLFGRVINIARPS